MASGLIRLQSAWHVVLFPVAPIPARSEPYNVRGRLVELLQHIRRYGQVALIVEVDKRLPELFMDRNCSLILPEFLLLLEQFNHEGGNLGYGGHFLSSVGVCRASLAKFARSCFAPANQEHHTFFDDGASTTVIFGPPDLSWTISPTL